VFTLPTVADLEISAVLLNILYLTIRKHLSIDIAPHRPALISQNSEIATRARRLRRRNNITGAQTLIHCQHCLDYIRSLKDAANQYGDTASLLVRVADQKQTDFSEALLLAKQALSQLQSARCEFESHRQQQHEGVLHLIWHT